MQRMKVISVVFLVISDARVCEVNEGEEEGGVQVLVKVCFEAVYGCLCALLKEIEK